MNIAPDLNLFSILTSTFSKAFWLVHSMNLDVNSWTRVILISYPYNLYTTARNSDRFWMPIVRHTNTLKIFLFPSIQVHINHKSTQK